MSKTKKYVWSCFAIATVDAVTTAYRSKFEFGPKVKTEDKGYFYTTYLTASVGNILLSPLWVPVFSLGLLTKKGRDILLHYKDTVKFDVDEHNYTMQWRKEPWNK